MKRVETSSKKKKKKKSITIGTKGGDKESGVEFWSKTRTKGKRKTDSTGENPGEEKKDERIKL